MGAVLFSDVHADAEALAKLAHCIRSSAFTGTFGPVDYLVNLGDLLHRGYEPRRTLEIFQDLSDRYRVISLMGNHDYAFLHKISVSGSDEKSARAHESLRGSSLLDIFTGISETWQKNSICFVHGGPLNLGDSWLEQKYWQRLSRTSGPSASGYHYTPEMAFEFLEKNHLKALCCGHQHQRTCCQKEGPDIQDVPINPVKVTDWDGPGKISVAEVSLTYPTIVRIGACRGSRPEFAYTDFSTFFIIELHEST